MPGAPLYRTSDSMSARTEPELSPMKSILLGCGLILTTAANLSAQSDPLPLSIQPRGSALDLSWPGSLRLTSGETVFPRFEIQESLDLKSWRALGPPLHSAGADTMQYSLSPSQPRAFYKLFADWSQIASHAPVLGGDQVFGYAAAFHEELQRIGQISPQAFAERYGITSAYLPGIDWDPTTGQYWNLFATDPV